MLVSGLAALFVLGAALPGLAWTKKYMFYNTTTVSQYSVQAVTNGLESITATSAHPYNWKPAVVGYAVVGGVFSTTITWGGTARAPGSDFIVIWETADGSCRLRDLRWGDGQEVVPYYAGYVPGGGMAFCDPDSGDWIVIITNDTDQAITLSDVEFAIAGQALAVSELEQLSAAGLVGLRVTSIDDDIGVLIDEVEYYGARGDISGPSANSLLKKLGRAVDYKHDGLDEYLAGDDDRALVFWAKAAKQMTNFISEVTAASQKGNLSLELYNRWVIGVPGGPTTAPEIHAALLALPDGQALQSFPELAGTLPAYPGLGSMVRVPWPAAELYPGEYTAFVVPGMNLDAGFIMGGAVLDGNGNVLLDWLEQAVAEPTPIDDTPPEITSASATPDYLWPPDHSIVEMTLDVAVADASYAIWYIADVTSNQDESGTGDGDTAPDWGTDPNDPQYVWLRAERSGNDPTETRIYTITLVAIDVAGNVSDPYELVVPVDHDQG